MGDGDQEKVQDCAGEFWSNQRELSGLAGGNRGGSNGSGAGTGKASAEGVEQELTFQRQFDRVLEMLLLRQLNRKDPTKLRAYRLHVSLAIH